MLPRLDEAERDRILESYLLCTVEGSLLTLAALLKRSNTLRYFRFVLCCICKCFTALLVFLPCVHDSSFAYVDFTHPFI